MSSPVVRFAPSPTGYLHVGGARTALFNFLFARQKGGKFLLRIEDTDRERSEPQFEKEILDSLTWLGMNWDGEPVRQSGRLPLYREKAAELISKGLAYEQEKEEKKAVLFKMPKREVAFDDLLRGRISFNTEIFEDLVLLKSDGYPTYHWACVIDDNAMGVTHVIRGEDHLTNTPKQILLLEALGYPRPIYVHLPLILGADGSPLSKRHGAVAVLNYRNEGFLAEGLFNYLALLGWGAANNQEFFKAADLIEKFSLKKLIRSAARFDFEKLRWLNAQHLRALSEEDYLKSIREYYLSVGTGLVPALAGRPQGAPLPQNFDQIALLLRSRIQTFKDLYEEGSYFFNVEAIHELPLPYQPDALEKVRQIPNLREKLKMLRDAFEALPSFEDGVKLEAVLRETAQKLGIEAKELIHPLRLALTGRGVSPGIFDVMKVLGKQTSTKRLDHFIRGQSPGDCPLKGQ